MRIRRSTILLALLAFPALGEEVTAPFHGSIVRFGSVERAKEFLGTSDDWSRSLSPFDRAVRLRSREPVDEKEFLSYAATQARGWEGSDIEVFSTVITEVEVKLKELGLQLPLPDEILVIRTTGDEEMGSMACYTRGPTIIISGGRIELERTRHTFLHELFHVMTRHDPSIRAPLYEIIGFVSCAEIPYPETLQPRRLTNPDAYHLDSYIELTSEGTTIRALPLTLARSLPYEQGGILQNLSIEFLEVELRGEDVVPRVEGGQPVLHAMDEVEGYFEKIGANTSYVIHPEEIMAENFTMAVLGNARAPNPEILEAVIERLARGKSREDSADQ